MLPCNCRQFAGATHFSISAQCPVAIVGSRALNLKQLQQLQKTRHLNQSDAGNDVRHVQRLSRHTKLDTLMIYDDNRQNLQSEVSASLAEMV